MGTSVIKHHIQTFDEIRRLGLVSHGLDLSSSAMFSGSEEYPTSEATLRILTASLSSALLQLAIAIRVNIYQATLCGLEKRELPWWASLYYKDTSKAENINLKTICDKIIHANSVGKDALPEEVLKGSKMCMQFIGTHKNREWVMDIPVHPFVEYVLALLDEIEGNNA